MEPKIYILILNWNGRDDLLECLDSVEKIDYPNFGVAVIDNGSSDGSIEALKRRFGRIEIIENNENLGFCRGNNIGIRFALERGAEYLLILNNDTVVEASIIKDLLAALSREKDRVVLNPLIAYWRDRQRIHWLGSKVDLGNGGIFARRGEKDCLFGDKLLDTDFVSWCAVFFSRKAIEAIGYLDESFFAYYEDIDWSFRARKNGFTPMIYPKVLLYHKCSRSSGGEYSPVVYFYTFRNRLIFIQKHAGNLRKLQFSFNYVNLALKRSDELSELANPEAAKAILDGVWSALTGNFNNKRAAMPEKVRLMPGIFKKAYLYCKTIRNLF